MIWFQEIMMMAFIITVGVMVVTGAVYVLYQLFGPWFVIGAIIIYGISLAALLKAYR